MENQGSGPAEFRRHYDEFILKHSWFSWSVYLLGKNTDKGGKHNNSAGMTL